MLLDEPRTISKTYDQRFPSDDAPHEWIPLYI